jgi:CheY-like chemotaxis protein
MDSTGSQLRVLVVEDCHDTAETLRFLLDLWGHDVRVAHSGHSALVVAPLFQPDVVLLDIGLPGPDGFQVAEKLKDATLAETPVLIATTGHV